MANDIIPGDILFDHNGKPVKVKLVQQYRSDNCYEVELSDGLTVAGDTHLRLPLETTKYRSRVDAYKGVFKFRRPLITKSLDELIETPLKDHRERHAFSIPTAKPLELPHQTLPVPPFVFGYWFFARGFRGYLNVAPKLEEQIFHDFKTNGYTPTVKQRGTGRRSYFTTTPSILSHLAPLIPTKIPNNYLLAAPSQRLELLRGIILGGPRSYSKKHKRFQVTVRVKYLAQQVQFLAESLGCRTVLQHNEDTNSYTLYFKTNHKLVDEQPTKPPRVHESRRFITKIHKLPPQLCVHIETDGGFLAQEGFIACL